MTGFEVVQSEGSLWTVGFHKTDGRWEPESDHDSERGAKTRAWWLNGVDARYVYWRSEPQLWTVGEVGGSVTYPHSDHDSWQEAAAEVHELNA